jgi:hypothetical protein
MRTVFDQPSDVNTKFYSPSEHLAVDEVNCALQRESHFQKVYSKET